MTHIHIRREIGKTYDTRRGRGEGGCCSAHPCTPIFLTEGYCLRMSANTASVSFSTCSRGTCFSLRTGRGGHKQYNP